MEDGNDIEDLDVGVNIPDDDIDNAFVYEEGRGSWDQIPVEVSSEGTLLSKCLEEEIRDHLRKVRTNLSVDEGIKPTIQEHLKVHLKRSTLSLMADMMETLGTKVSEQKLAAFLHDYLVISGHKTSHTEISTNQNHYTPLMLSTPQFNELLA